MKDWYVTAWHAGDLVAKRGPYESYGDASLARQVHRAEPVPVGTVWVITLLKHPLDMYKDGGNPAISDSKI